MAGQPKKQLDLARLANEPGLGEQVLEALEEGMTLIDLWDLTGLGKAAILEWLEQDAGRAARTSRVRARVAHALVDQSITIADTAGLTKEELAKAKLQTQVRQWAAERWNRSAYGQKVEVSGHIDITHQHLEALQRRQVARLQPADPVVLDVEPKTLEQQLAEL